MIDFHCHLDLYPNPHQVVDTCRQHDLYVLSVTTTPSAWNGTSALVDQKDRIRTALGLHPQLAHERHGELSIFDKLLPKVSYVGEIGLDGSSPFSHHWEIQVKVFEYILSACVQVGGRIMSIHSRRASGAVLDKLEFFKGAGVPVLHWFSGSFRDLERAILLGCWFSVGSPMLTSVRRRALVAKMPHDRVLTESDGPFTQVDGRSAMPWEVEKTVREISEIWSQSFEETQCTLRENLRQLLLVSRIDTVTKSKDSNKRVHGMA